MMFPALTHPTPAFTSTRKTAVINARPTTDVWPLDKRPLSQASRKARRAGFVSRITAYIFNL